MSYTNLDPNQIAQVCFDDKKGAQKVTIVGLDSVNLSADMSPVVDELKLIKQELNKTQTPEVIEKTVFVPSPPEIKVVEVEKVVIQPEIKVVETQTVIKETVYRELPITVVETRFERVEVPVISTQIKEVLPTWATIVIAVQSALVVSLAIAKFIK